MGNATKAKNSPYYLARMEAAENNDDLSSREGAAALTGIERTRLARIELDMIAPYPDEVRMMAEAYNMPELLNLYCAHGCPIGRCMDVVLPACSASSIAELAVQAAVSLRNAEAIRETLLDICADGVIDEQEQVQFAQLLDRLGQISKVAHQMQAIAMKLQR